MSRCEALEESIERAWMAVTRVPRTEVEAVYLARVMATVTGWIVRTGPVPRDGIEVGVYNRGVTLKDLREAVYHVLEREAAR